MMNTFRSFQPTQYNLYQQNTHPNSLGLLHVHKQNYMQRLRLSLSYLLVLITAPCSHSVHHWHDFDTSDNNHKRAKILELLWPSQESSEGNKYKWGKLREDSKEKLCDYCEDVSKLQQTCSKKERAQQQGKREHPDHLLFIAIQFYKSGSSLWFSEERKYSYWNVYSTLPFLLELFI